MTTIRRGLLAALGLAAAALLAGGCGGRAKPPVGVTQLDGPLGAGDLTRVLRLTGVEVERYVVNAPYPHQLYHRLAQYRGGKLSGSYAEGSANCHQPPGKPYRMVAMAEQTPDGMLYVSVAPVGWASNAIVGGRAGMGVTTTGFASGGFQPLRGLPEGKLVPLYMRALNKSGRSPNLEKALRAAEGSPDPLLQVARQCDELTVFLVAIKRLK